MADAGDMKKEREPITLVCGIVLLIAVILVVGVYVNNEFIQRHEETVEYGDSITVDYVGSLYTYYDQGTDAIKPIIFDTSIESVGTNADNLFTGSFSKSEYKTMTITAGNDSNVLKAFSTAVVGHKVGETVEVCIPAKDAYVAADNNKLEATHTFHFSNGFTMSLEDFNKYYGQNLSATAGTQPISFHGLNINAVVSGNSVKVTYLSTTEAVEVYNTALGKVTMSIDAAAGEFTLTVSDAKATGKEIKGVAEIEMISLDIIPVAHMNILGYNDTQIVFNNSGYDSEKKVDTSIYNMDLYFKITIVSKS